MQVIVATVETIVPVVHKYHYRIVMEGPVAGLSLDFQHQMHPSTLDPNHTEGQVD